MAIKSPPIPRNMHELSKHVFIVSFFRTAQPVALVGLRTAGVAGLRWAGLCRHHHGLGRTFDWAGHPQRGTPASLAENDDIYLHRSITLLPHKGLLEHCVRTREPHQGTWQTSLAACPGTRCRGLILHVFFVVSSLFFLGLYGISS